MTHKDIYTKFMIEYDKANVTSSYPSLTEYEVATVLDKAYNALIAQKVTGNNIRRAPFEADNKSISDLAPLVVRQAGRVDSDNVGMPAPNVCKVSLPENFLYYVDASFSYTITNTDLKDHFDAAHIFSPTLDTAGQYVFQLIPTYLQCASDIEVHLVDLNDNVIEDGTVVYVRTKDNLNSVEHQSAFVLGENVMNNESLQKYLDALGEDIYVVVESVKYKGNARLKIYSTDSVQSTEATRLPMDGVETRTVPVKIVSHDMAQKFFSTMYNMPWIKIPVCFIESGSNNKYAMYIVYDPIYGVQDLQSYQLTYIKAPNTFVKNLDKFEDDDVSYFMNAGGNVEFELNDTMAEELISLAIAFALENIESVRLGTKLNMRGLEA